MDSIEDYNPTMDNMEEWRQFWCTLAHFHVEFAPIYNWYNNNEKWENDYMFFTSSKNKVNIMKLG
jgi:hypothetical protein